MVKNDHTSSRWTAMVIIASGSGAAERRIILLGGHPMHSLEPQFEILPHVNSSMLHRLRTQGTVYHYFTLLKNKKGSNSMETQSRP